MENKIKLTIINAIVQYLQEKRDWCWGGNICRAVHEMTGHKEGVIERRLREMTDGKGIPHELEVIEKARAKLVNGKHGKYIEFVEKGGSMVYRYKELFGGFSGKIIEFNNTTFDSSMKEIKQLNLLAR